MENDKHGDDFASLLEESASIQKRLEIGDAARATVLSIDHDNIYLDLGTRENGVISRAEFFISGNLTIGEGETIEVFIANKKRDIYYCTRRASNRPQEVDKANSQVSAEVLRDALQMGVPVKGRVTKVIKGGLEVTVKGQRAFCPISQIELNFCDNPDHHLNKTYEFKIIEFEDNGLKIILSRKKLLAEENIKVAHQRWQEIREGDIYSGRVTAIKDYGVFVDIGAIEGLLHISEISFDKTVDPASQFTVGDTLDVQVLSMDREKQRLSLSLKSILEDPWDTVAADLSPGTELAGQVVKIKPYGAFVKLFPGVEGLLHISKLGVNKRIDHPKQVLKPGQQVNVRILDINAHDRHISLTMEEVDADYSKDLKKLKKDQEKEFKKQGTMASLLDDIGK